MMMMGWESSIYASKLGPTYMCDDYGQGTASLKW